jgi:hypothetical protein
MHYEHRERSFAMAIECVRAARQIADSEALRKRHDRLQRRMPNRQATMTAGLL